MGDTSPQSGTFTDLSITHNLTSWPFGPSHMLHHKFVLLSFFYGRDTPEFEDAFIWEFRGLFKLCSLRCRNIKPFQKKILTFTICQNVMFNFFKHNSNLFAYFLLYINLYLQYFYLNSKMVPVAGRPK